MRFWRGHRMMKSTERIKQLETRIAELEAREKELDRREKEVKKLERMIPPEAIKDWPPCYPIAHNNITKDIPSEKRTMVRIAYYLWLHTVICLVWNVVCIVAMWVSKGGSKWGGLFALALVYCLLGTPLAWSIWYKPLYKAGMRGKSRHYMNFLLSFGFHFLFCVLMVLGLSETASAGIIMMIDAFTENPTVGLFVLVAACAWGMNVCIGAFLWKYARDKWKREGLNDTQMAAVATAFV
eukprot:TRINITY_DN755_c0_g1_i1.p1 TRINITY_DN755_c0_g1~~TRINITY_DN755_c0_g1_i1.p1  ORF type:complete len:239 (-),score=40.12 TRINITY_DN755_c0_g1_i1:13-729(-)